jgi:LAS superfamily LD-carboxypeptidase LdcB
MQLNWRQQIGLDSDHLVTVDKGFGSECQVHMNVAEPLQALMDAAKNDGVAIAIVSSYRDFATQLKIWNEKWMGHRPIVSRHGRLLNTAALSEIEKYKAISLFSALPGLSRHHWGTDLDIFAVDPIMRGYKVQLTPGEFAQDGPCAELACWLSENLNQFDFYRPYDRYRGGVAEEPWHISYRPLAQDILAQFDFDAHREFLAQSDIQAKAFILEKLPHYRQHYFLNVG